MASLNKVISAFSDYYNSINVTIVAKKLKDRNENILSSIVFTVDKLEEVKLVTLYEDKDVVITRHFLAMDNVTELFEQFKNGMYKIFKYAIRYNNFDPDILTVDYYREDRYSQIQDTIIFGAERREKLAHIPDVWDVLKSKNGIALLEGYSDIFDMIADLTGIIDYRQNFEFDVKFIFPLEVKVNNFEIKDQEIIINILKSQNLKKLQLNIKITRIEISRRYVVFRDKYPIESEDTSINWEFKVENLYPKDMVELLLISRSLPELIIAREVLWAPAEKPLQPYAVTFNMFYSIEDLRDKLLNPSRFKNAGELFEESVTILLALCGFSPIHLGKEYERLKLESKYEMVSADIIAFVEKEGLFLIDCDTQVPDPSKISKIMALRQYLEDNEDLHDIDNIVPVIITPLDCSKFETTISDVVILDRNWIIKTLEDVMMGNTNTIAQNMKYMQFRPL
jgi:hypothetical protein